MELILEEAWEAVPELELEQEAEEQELELSEFLQKKWKRLSVLFNSVSLSIKLLKHISPATKMKKWQRTSCSNTDLKMKMIRSQERKPLLQLQDSSQQLKTLPLLKTHQLLLRTLQQIKQHRTLQQTSLLSSHQLTLNHQQTRTRLTIITVAVETMMLIWTMVEKEVPVCSEKV